ncbi:HPr family phosphocarrier protein [Bacillus licheniformis]|nr:HPr family phosphocarrier protein [Bacillus licheniformis]
MVLVTNQQFGSPGLQARHTTLFVRKAISFKSEIVLAKTGRQQTGKI